MTQRPTLARGRRLARAALVCAALALACTRARLAHAEDAAPSGDSDSATDAGLEVEAWDDPLKKGARDRTVASTVVRRDRLQAPGKSAADVLAEVPGVAAFRTGAGTDLATVAIRGATSAQTPVYVAGMRINDELTGTADLSAVPTWMIDRVEVYRGGAPADADRLGLGGAVFFEPVHPRRSNVIAGYASSTLGERTEWLGGAAGDGRTAALLALRHELVDNDYTYVDDRGTRSDASDDRTARRSNARAETFDAWAIARHAYDGGARVTLLAHALSRRQGLTGLGITPADRAEGRARRSLWGARASAPCGATAGREVACAIDLSAVALLADHDVSDPLTELGLGASEIQSTGTRAGPRASVAIGLFERAEIRVVAAQTFERLAIDSLTAPALRARRSSSHGALAARVDATDWLEIHVLAALDREITTGEAELDSGTLGTGRLGVRVAPIEPLALFANAGRYVRVPTLGELFGVSAVALGNPALAPESGWSGDVGARLEGEARPVRGAIEAFGFLRSTEDLVVYRRSSFGVVRPFNERSARVLGLEAAGSLTAWEHLRGELSLTLLDPRATTEDRPPGSDLLPLYARLAAVPRVEVFTNDGLPSIALSAASFAVTLNHRASRVADDAGLVVLAARTAIDADLVVAFLGGRITSRARVANLLDDQSTDLAGLPLPGRSFHQAIEGRMP